MAKGSILERLRQLTAEAAEAAEVDLSPDQIHDDAFLPDLFDSLGLSAILTLAEDEWNIRFSDEEITPELFENLPALASAIAAKAGR